MIVEASTKSLQTTKKKVIAPFCSIHDDTKTLDKLIEKLLGSQVGDDESVRMPILYQIKTKTETPNRRTSRSNRNIFSL